MNEQQLAQKARAHWTKWRPAQVAEMKAAGTFEATMQALGKLAAAQYRELVAAGYQAHEADEVVLAHHILVAPEPEAASPAWECEELQARERSYQASMKD